MTDPQILEPDDVDGQSCPTCAGRGWHTAGANDPMACSCPAGEAWSDEDGQAAGAELADPINGELVDPRAFTTIELGDWLTRLDEFLGRVRDFRQAFADEVIRRLDSMAERKTLVGDFELETNAPTSIDYREDVLRTELEELVKAGELDPGIIGKVFPTPAPSPPPVPKLSKRELNKLKADPRVAPAIAKASVRVNNNRTLKVSRKERSA